MSQLMQPFDATKVDPTQGGGQMPVGKHPVVIKASEIVPTKDNTGGMLVLTLEIIDGPSKGVTGPYRLNLYNNNPQAVEIAHKQLSAICHVTGVYQVTHSEQLHGHPFVVEIGLQKGAEEAAKGYTEVKRVYDMNGNEPGKAAPSQAQQQAGNGGGAWGGAQQQAPQAAQQGAPAAGGGWGGQQSSAPAPGAGAGGQGAGGWGGGAPAAGGGAPWGAKK